MTRIVSRAEIEAALSGLDLIGDIEAAFVAYSNDRAVVPPVGELLLPNGEVHIKYGYVTGEAHYLVKIASGFAGNRDEGLSPNNGMMLLFNQQSGEVEAILLDEGWLTDVRTALAGAVVAKHLAPTNVERIGIIGTGIQARLQLHHLKDVTDCRDVVVWGRHPGRVEEYVAEMNGADWTIQAASSPATVGASCNLVVTTTSSREPLLNASDIRPGTHVTAVGSDTPDKQEVDSQILADADLVVADSVTQCLLRGEIYRAVTSGQLAKTDICELGDVISGSVQGRRDDAETTIADLTGVAVQDIAIASAVFGVV